MNSDSPAAHAWRAVEERADEIVPLMREAIRLRLKVVSRVTGTLPIEGHEFQDFLRSTLYLGWVRARITRFSQEQHLTKEWFEEERLRRGHHRDDRRVDHRIITDAFPAFVDSYAPALSDAEIIKGAEIEVYDHYASRGTDYYYRRNDRSAAVPVPEGKWLVRATRVAKSSKGTSPGDMEPEYVHVDPDATDRIENADYWRLVEDERHRAGPAVTRALQVAVEEFGVAGLYWVGAKLTDDMATHLLEAIGGVSQESVGAKEFGRIRRDLERKVLDGGLNEEILTRLASDGELREIAGHLHPPPTLLPAPIPSSGEAETHRSLAEQERDASLTRRQARFYRRIEETFGADAGAIIKQDVASGSPLFRTWEEHGAGEAAWDRTSRTLSKRLRQQEVG